VKTMASASTSSITDTARSLIKRNPELIEEDRTVIDAAKQLAREDIGSLPICDEDGNIKGVVTDRDIVVKVIAKGKDPAKIRLRELEEGPPITIDASDSLQRALTVMEEHKIRRLPVLEGDKCIGVISQADLATALPREKVGELLESISTD